MNFFEKNIVNKKLNIFLVIIFGLIALTLYLFIQLEYCGNLCSGEVVRGILWPIYYGTKMLFLSFIIFLFIPANIFRRWMLYVLPISLFLIIRHVMTTETDASGMFNLGKVGVTKIDSLIFLGVTVFFVGVNLIYNWRISNRNFLNK